MYNQKGKVSSTGIGDSSPDHTQRFAAKFCYLVAPVPAASLCGEFNSTHAPEAIEYSDDVARSHVETIGEDPGVQRVLRRCDLLQHLATSSRFLKRLDKIKDLTQVQVPYGAIS